MSDVQAGRPGPVTAWQMRLLLAQAGLAAPPHRPLRVERDIPVPADDGVALLTDHWSATGERSGHIVLMRTPYGRRQSEAAARLFALFGHDVVVQSCRGTFGSAGTFTPFLNEQADGVAAFAWLRAQSWYAGSVHTFGPSYVGLTQWAIAQTPPEGLQAINVAITSRTFRDAVVYPGGGFGMETALSWFGALDAQEQPWTSRLARTIRVLRGVPSAADTVPPREAMSAMLGHDVDAFDDWLIHNAPGDPYWEGIDFSRRTDQLPKVTIVAGWQDLFATEQLQDVAALQAAGVAVRTVVGPWTHTDSHVAAHALREALVGLGSVPAPATAATTRLWVGGSEPVGWRTTQQWPPPATEKSLHLTDSETLHSDPPTTGWARRWRHDPADPAPSAGGRALNPLTAGARSQRAREKRPDVLLWTGAPLTDDLVVVGVPTLSVTVAADGPHDLFARLCDVDARGRSHTVCDVILRLPAPEAREPRLIRLDLGPAAHRFATGHSVRLQVSAAAHPLYLRHPGWPAPLGDVDRFEVRELQVVGGPDAAGVLTLPVVNAS